jgi:hypothetical protein
MTTRTRIRAALAALILALTVLLAGTGPAPADDEPPPSAFTINGLDLHDAQIVQDGDQYVMVGSMYGCGYSWYTPGTTWCGFGASTATDPRGPWSTPTLLFPTNSIDPSTGYTWQQVCGTQTGQGCFNPRLIQRTGWGSNDGVWILYFNSPRQYSLGAPHAYNSMGCNAPTGPCGPTAGTPHGSYTKPNLPICAGANGDLGVIQSAAPSGRPAIICTRAGTTGLSIQELNWWGTGGTSTGVAKVAGIEDVEGPGGWWDEATQQYVLTYSDQGCGYCAGTPIGYATSPSLYSGWTAPGNVGWGAPLYGRRIFNGNSCGGQPRTVTVLDGQPWQIIDLWIGQRNETAADTHLVPLAYTPTTGTPGDGQIWRPPLRLDC